MKREICNFLGPKFPDRPNQFDPERDFQEVEQFGFVNLSEAYEKGIIPGDVQFTDQDFNGCMNPGTLISRSQDVFDGMRKRAYVEAQLSKLNAQEREKVENALARQAQKENQISVEVSPEG